MGINYAALQSLVTREFLQPIEETVVRENPTLRAINKKNVASDAIYMQWKASSDHAARGIADGSDVTVTGAGTSRKSAVLNWVTYVADFSLNKRTLDQLSSQPGVLGKLLYDEINDAAKDLVDRIAADIMGSAGSTPDTKLTGILDIINAGNTYAGVDRTLADNAGWRGVSITNRANTTTAGPLSTITMDRADTAFYNANGFSLREKAGMFTGVTSAAVLEKYEQLFTSITLGDLSNAHFVNQMNNTGMFGESIVGYKGVPLMRDRNTVSAAGDIAGSNRLYFLNMDKIFLASLRSNSDLAMRDQIAGAVRAEDTQGIDIKVELLPNKGERVDGYVKAYVQLFSPNPKAAGVAVTDILVS